MKEVSSCVMVVLMFKGDVTVEDDSKVVYASGGIVNGKTEVGGLAQGLLGR